jgi:ATP-dependent DNA helicase RecG
VSESTDKKAADKKSAGTAREKLAKLGLRRDVDFLLHLPLRYEDETTITPIALLESGQSAQIEAVVEHSEVTYRPRRQLVLRLKDETGELFARFLNFYGSQLKAWQVGARVRARGEVRGGFFGTEMVHPRMNKVGEDAALPTTLTPVYPASAGVPQGLIRKAIDRVLERESTKPTQQDYLPDPLRAQLHLPALLPALNVLHHPPPDVPHASLHQRTHPAWQRVKFDELLAQQLSLTRARDARAARTAAALQDDVPLTRKLLAGLPFKLTQAQQCVWNEIRADMAKPYPMHRLLQGDVGSGKTVVAALACVHAIGHGMQAAMMAPTELLAEQHFRKVADWLAPLGVNVVWLTGSLKKREKAAAQAACEDGSAQLIIGTHALIQDKVRFAKLGLAVIDEQHRFGVGQRLRLRSMSAGGEPHILSMSATPIPRTLAMTYFADLEVSIIDELPPGRTPVVTKLVDENRRAEIIERVREWCATGQVYWVCPLVEESEALELQNAIDTHAALSEALAPLTVGLVHGRLSAADKQAVMDDFISGKTRVLVATTVIEVGVDVPNASLMVIEHAERFGLAQLHQLRGRVGRGAAQSVCVLMYSGPLSPHARERLKTMKDTQDGFAIARKDLELRGPGEFLGARQSGLALLRFADLEADSAWVERARETAAELIAHYPQNADACLQWWMGGKEEFLKA